MVDKQTGQQVLMAKRPNNNNIILLLLPSTDGAASFHYQMKLNMTGNNHEIPPGHYSISIIQNCTRMHPTMNNLRVVGSTSFTRIGGKAFEILFSGIPFIQFICPLDEDVRAQGFYYLPRLSGCHIRRYAKVPTTMQ